MHLLWFRHDLRLTDNDIVIYRDLNLDCHLGLNNFLQASDDRQDLFQTYYTYQRQPQYQPPLKLDLPTLSILQGRGCANDIP